MSKSDEARAALTTPPNREKTQTDRDFVSSGVTLIDKAITGKIGHAFAKGLIYRLAGRSGAGKTFLARTLLAEAARNANFDDYELVYDDVERGALMDTFKFFGELLVNRLVAPGYAKGRVPLYSRTILDFYRRLKAKLEAGKKVFWIEDSMDALVPEVETKMTDGKAKINSQRLRELVDLLDGTGSILVLVSQAHVDMRSMFGGDLAAGGRALEFYPCLDIWLRKVKTLKTLHKKRKYPTGITVAAHISKNRVSGLDRTVYFPFDPNYGIDDIGANIDFLITTGHWSKRKGIIEAPEFGFDGNRKALLREVEQEGLQRELQVLTGKVWDDIEAAVRSTRLPRYQ